MGQVRIMNFANLIHAYHLSVTQLKNVAVFTYTQISKGVMVAGFTLMVVQRLRKMDTSSRKDPNSL